MNGSNDVTPRAVGGSIFKALLLILLVGFLCWMLLPQIGSGPVSPRGRCEFSLHFLGLAMKQYHEDNGCFPPAYIADEHGRPIHSWRVLLLPYLSSSSVFAQYNFDEPWDGPNNILLLDADSTDYRCAADQRADTRYTSYVTITGSGTVFDADGCIVLKDISDGPDNTIMLVELAESDILWTEPRDLRIEELRTQINQSKQGVSSNHADGANVLFCSGRVEFLMNRTPLQAIKALSTIRGGEDE